MRAKLLTVSLMAIPLAGCLFPPQIVDSGPSTVAVRMSTAASSFGNPQEIADLACSEHAASAEYRGTEGDFGDGTVIQHYNCVPHSSSLGLASADGSYGSYELSESGNMMIDDAAQQQEEGALGFFRRMIDSLSGPLE